MNNYDASVNVAAKTTRRLKRLGGFLAAAVAMSALVPGVTRADVYTFGTLIGNAIALDHIDGTGNNARLLNPTGVAVDSAGNISNGRYFSPLVGSIHL